MATPEPWKFVNEACHPDVLQQRINYINETCCPPDCGSLDDLVREQVTKDFEVRFRGELELQRHIIPEGESDSECCKKSGTPFQPARSKNKQLIFTSIHSSIPFSEQTLLTAFHKDLKCLYKGADAVQTFSREVEGRSVDATVIPAKCETRVPAELGRTGKHSVLLAKEYLGRVRFSPTGGAAAAGGDASSGQAAPKHSFDPDGCFRKPALEPLGALDIDAVNFASRPLLPPKMLLVGGGPTPVAAAAEAPARPHKKRK
eukprot:GDKH01019663.1.p1 GENE.GDKH01019663.1~~GDKH01019663.1.p1  ORF type:complete len:259 (+),score=36.22 GDKH01019663.1:121-897(+)